MNKEKQFNLRLTPEQLQAIKANAAKAGKTTSEFIIAMCTQNVYTNDDVYTNKEENVYTNKESVRTKEPVIKETVIKKPVKPTRETMEQKVWKPYLKSDAAK